MSRHGNSHQNPNPHHLYGIFERETEDVLKYGITDDPIEEDGLPRRASVQLRWANLAAGFLKFFVKILRSGIPGRAEAERIERDHIEAYRKKQGHRPPGNLK